MSPLRLNIQARLDALGWSQAELARRTGLRQADVSGYVTGRRALVHLPDLEAMARELGVDPPGALIVDAADVAPAPGPGAKRKRAPKQAG